LSFAGEIYPKEEFSMRKLAALALMAFAALLTAQTQAPVVSTDPGATVRPPLPLPRDPKLPTLFLVGDSTVRNGRGNGAGGQWCWGEPLADLFDLTRINVTNRAIGGRSSRTYQTEGRWQETLDLVKPGDVVLFQFGHNDNGPLDDTARARGTLSGTGEETKEIFNPLTKQQEVVHTYGWYMRRYVREARAKGATPILCSLIPRKTWKNGKIERANYADWAKQVAEEEKIPFLDLNAAIAARYDALGEEKVEAYFADPHTHTSRIGAELNAQVVVSLLKALPHDPVAKFYSSKGSAVLPAGK
jgi:lysophospholipase L1-like esterase